MQIIFTAPVRIVNESVNIYTSLFHKENKKLPLPGALKNLFSELMLRHATTVFRFFATFR